MSYGSPYQSNPYQESPSTEAGYGHAQEQHEMQPYGQADAAPSNVLTQQQFLSRVSEVRNEMRDLGSDVQQIAALHQRALNSSDSAAQHQLEALVAQTQLKNTSIRDQIRALKADAERTHDSTFGIKSRQVESVNSDFKKEVNRYLQEEQTYKERYREQIARQFRIVNPEATDEEVQQAADADWGNEGIFQTALKTNRSGQASAVLGNVRARHNELQKIEKSINELASLFQDIDTLVVQQEDVVVRAEQQTEVVNTNIDLGNKEVDKGIKHARNRRKLKWICFFICVLIIIAIGLGVGLGVYFANKGNSTKTS